ncbi:Long chain acyl-CoA synthetase 7 peroxisomal, partial [Physocladia obscura]
MDQTSVILGVAAIALLAKYRNDKFRSEVKDVHTIILRNQSSLGQTRNRGEWAVLRNRETPVPTKDIPQFISSLKDAFSVQLSRSSSQSGQLDGVYITANSFAPHVSAIGHTLTQLLATVEKGNKLVGIFVRDKRDALEIDIACHLFGFVSVWWSESAIPHHQDVLDKILEITELQVLAVSVSDLDVALDSASESKSLQHILVFGKSPVSKFQADRANSLKIKITNLDLIRSNSENATLLPIADRIVKQEGEELASVVFKYGSLEKRSLSQLVGVSLTHLNLSVSTSALYITLPRNRKISEDDILVVPSSREDSNFDSGARLFERTLVYAVLLAGGKVVFAKDETPIVQIIAEIKPTLLHSSSKTLHEIAKAIEDHQTAKGWGFTKVKAGKILELREGRCWTGTIWDRYFLTGLQKDLFGGRLRCIWNSTSATDGNVSHELKVIDLVRAIVGSQILKTFSHVETSGIAFSTIVGDYDAINHVGVPSANFEYKIVDKPSRQYFVSDSPNPRGELRIRGPAVSKAYFKDKTATAAIVVDNEGWIRMNGIAGEVRANGTL